jgi:ParB/RepB/Spo0J family partition protein
MELNGQYEVGEVHDIPLTEIVAGNNDRTQFDPQKLAELGESIRKDGLKCPVCVRWNGVREMYEIIYGERRFRASQLIGAPTIRALVADATDEEASIAMLAENTARQDLDPIDEAQGYQSRMIRFNWTDREIADKAGVSLQRVRNRLALLSLREDFQGLVRSGQFTIGYAQILAEAELDKNRQLVALRKYQENPSPTLVWFRRTCGELSQQQAQGDLFDSPLFGGTDFSATQTVQKVDWQAPADPRKDSAPQTGASHRDVIANQIQFWNSAADLWDRYGKSAPRDRCLAAAQALQAILPLMPKGKAKRFTSQNVPYIAYPMQ